MPEYYLTRAEFEIFSRSSRALIEAMGLRQNRYFKLVELGAGDGQKTKVLLHALVEQGYRFSYCPIDISQHALDGLERSLHTALPSLSVEKRHGDYFEMLEASRGEGHPKVVLFLGSNLGNMSDAAASDFVRKLGMQLNPGDSLLLGLDLIKEAAIVLPAYQDAEGITRDFNLNLLLRINRELDADFDLKAFEHSPSYDAQQGIAHSYLESKIAQRVHISKIGKSFSFKQGEKIHTESSRKYHDEILQRIITDSGLQINARFTDGQELFADYILKRQA